MKFDADKVYVYREEIDGSQASFERYQEIARAALSRLDLDLPSEGTILLKPNITIPADPDSRIITHPGFILGMLEALLDKGVERERLVVAESASRRGEEVWARDSGYADALARLGMTLTGMNDEGGVDVEVPGGVIFEKLRLFPEVAECGYFINVPVAKCHNLSGSTLCTKNMQGMVVSPQRHMCSVQEEDKHLPSEELARITDSGLSLHEDRFCNKHSDMISVRRHTGIPRLCVIDGVVGRDGTGFQHGENRPMGWTVIGENEVCVDAVGTFLMGLDPEETPYLKVANQRGLGTHRIDEIDVVDLATGEALDREALKTYMVDPPLMPVSRCEAGYYARFRSDGSVVPWALDRVNQQRLADGLEPIPFDSFPIDDEEKEEEHRRRQRHHRHGRHRHSGRQGTHRFTTS